MNVGDWIITNHKYYSTSISHRCKDCVWPMPVIYHINRYFCAHCKEEPPKLVLTVFLLQKHRDKLKVK